MLFTLLFGLILSIALIILGAVLLAAAAGSATTAMGAIAIILGGIALITTCIMFAGLKVVHPNEAVVFTLFGQYYGTIKRPGYYYINPFASAYNPSSNAGLGSNLEAAFTGDSQTSEKNNAAAVAMNFDKKISTKTLTFNNHRQKVNDALGNPVIIGAAVIWKVVNPTKAVFNVDNYKSFLSIQCDAVIRNNARLYPYDVMENDVDEKTLRGSSQEIADNMKQELQRRVDEAGIEIKEVRITHLAYSEEIAAAMLQRQQATAIIAARQKIVEGAVSMVKMAIDQLGEEEIVVLDEERKAAMVSNLLVVLCGNKDAQPVVNSSSIY
ncbi:MAG: SPFH domain-containing protein [Clostridium sp.]|nr:SPFH domain-containing protein [Clostridium sp.]